MGIKLENKILDSAPAPMKKDEEIPELRMSIRDHILLAGCSIGFLAMAALIFYAWIKAVGG
jgi:hypothetical protein